MVAKTIPFPNVRRLFIPSPGHFIAEADLSGAEAQVVAWDAGDEDLKAAFRSGINVHTKNARDVFANKVKGWSDEAIKDTDHPGGVYYICKRCVHATHNGGKPPGLAREIGISVTDAKNFQDIWYGLHPAILSRHSYILDCLHGRVEGNPARTIINRFGYRITFFDRIENVFTEALTWIQQSTVGICCFKGAIAMHKQTPWAKKLLQVHDSIVFQFPIALRPKTNEISTALHSVIIPYDDPLCIPWKLSISLESWGAAEAADW